MSVREWYINLASGNDSTGDGLTPATAWLTHVGALNAIGARASGVYDVIWVTGTTTTPLGNIGSTSYTNNGTGTRCYFVGYETTPGDGGLCHLPATFYGGGAHNLSFINHHLQQNGNGSQFGYDVGMHFLGCHIERVTGASFLAVHYSGQEMVAIGNHYDAGGLPISEFAGPYRIFANNYVEASDVSATGLLTADTSAPTAYIGNVFQFETLASSTLSFTSPRVSWINNTWHVATLGSYGVQLGSDAYAIDNLFSGFGGAAPLRGAGFAKGNRFWGCTAQMSGDVFDGGDNIDLESDPFEAAPLDLRPKRIAVVGRNWPGLTSPTIEAAVGGIPSQGSGVSRPVLSSPHLIGSLR